MSVSEDAITGTLKKATGFIQFSTTSDEQSGNYLVLNVTANPSSEVKTSVELISGKTASVKNSGSSYVIRVTDNSTQKVKITSTKGGYEPATKTYNLTGLTLSA